MKKSTLLFLVLMLCISNCFNQSVGIGENEFTPHESAALEILSNNKGLLIPRLNEDELSSIESPAVGLLVYLTGTNGGFYYYNGFQWKPLASSVSDSDTDTTNEIQTLSIVEQSLLQLSKDGGIVPLSELGDNMGNHTAAANISTNGHYISYDGSAGGIYITPGNFLALGEPNAIAPLTINTKDDTQMWLYNTSESPALMCLAMNPSVTSVFGKYFMTFIRNGSEIGSIEANLSTVSYNTTSDKRLKENIKPTCFGLADLMKIEVCDYNFVGAQNTTTGFLAQDLYKIVPFAVSVGGDDPKTKPWAIDYGKLTPILTKSVQELNIKVESLEDENKLLLKENEKLKEAINRLNDYENRLLLLEKQLNEKNKID